MGTKKKYVTVTLELAVYKAEDIFCASGDLSTVDIYDDGWTETGLEN